MDDAKDATKPTFLERMRAAELTEQRRIGARNGRVADIARGAGRDRAGEIVTIEDGDGVTTGAFVVEVIGVTGTVWQAVNDGKRPTRAWYTREMAILHLLSLRYGDGHSQGSAAEFAARVLGITDDPKTN